MSTACSASRLGGVTSTHPAAVSAERARAGGGVPDAISAGAASGDRPWDLDPLKFELELPNSSKAEFDRLLRLSWASVDAMLPACSEERPYPSTVNSPNRLRDQARVEAEHGLSESGRSDVVFEDKRGEVIARGYERVVYGDHGPYIEFRPHQICWDAFVHHKVKGPGRHYHEHYTSDSAVKLYDQLRTVRDQPNPPPGKYSCNNNRREGYADYRVGRLYISPDDIVVSRARQGRVVEGLTLS